MERSASALETSALLGRLRDGDDDAFDALLPRVYDELHRLAHQHRRRWTGNETLNTTALLHEAYLKLVEADGHDWEDRVHFLHAASRAMRHVLINYAERRSAEKRGGGRAPVSLHRVAHLLRDPRASSGHEVEALVALDRALERLADLDVRSAEIVECRVFGGMTIAETARALGVSEATVSRGWSVAQAWLRRELVGEDSS